MNTAAFEINYEVYDTLSRLSGYDTMGSPNSRSERQPPRIVQIALALAAIGLFATVVLFSEPLDVGQRFPFVVQLAILIGGSFVAIALILYGVLAGRNRSLDIR